jgi:hypothetical protein
MREVKLYREAIRGGLGGFLLLLLIAWIAFSMEGR